MIGDICFFTSFGYIVDQIRPCLVQHYIHINYSPQYPEYQIKELHFNDRLTPWRLSSHSSIVKAIHHILRSINQPRTIQPNFVSQLENFTFWFQLENLFLIIEIFFENLDFDFLWLRLSVWARTGLVDKSDFASPASYWLTGLSSR